MRIEKYKIMANDKEALFYYLQMVEATADGSKTIVETTEQLEDVEGEPVVMEYYELVDYEPPVEETPQLSYEELVAQKIRLRYSMNDELAILRQRDTKPQEFAEYNQYCEECKAEARAELEG